MRHASATIRFEQTPSAGRRASVARMLALLGVLALAASAAQAQPAATPAPKAAPALPTTQPMTGVPGIGEIVDAVNKATEPKAGAKNDWSPPIKMAFVFGALALLPTVLVMMTSFTRIVIVLGFVRRALTTQSIPPTIAIIGLALFLTLFTMAGTFAKINQQALQPYLQEKLSFEAACTRGNTALKEFMLRQTRQSDVAMFLEMARIPRPERIEDIPSYVTIPAFAISEFRTAFEMACLLFIPFLLVDLVISSILLSTGMMMLPPSMISLPFKIILFVLVDGWKLLSQALVNSFF